MGGAGCAGCDDSRFPGGKGRRGPAGGRRVQNVSEGGCSAALRALGVARNFLEEGRAQEQVLVLDSW